VQQDVANALQVKVVHGNEDIEDVEIAEVEVETEIQNDEMKEEKKIEKNARKKD
jgi:hypothetical protein